MDTYDIVIIGGGISGLYAGWKIQQDPILRSKHCAIFERSDRLGGRIETVPLNGFLAETGAMRIEPDLQLMLNQLIYALNLPVIDTFEHYGITRVPDTALLFPLREDEKNKTPLQLLYIAISRILNIPIAELSQLQGGDFHNIYQNTKYKEKFLWQMGWWEILSEVLSYGAIQYINHYGHFYHFIQENLNAAAEIVFFIRVLKTNYRLKNIRGGMFKLIEALENQLQDAYFPIYKNHQLIAMHHKDNKVELKFKNNKVIYAKNVILTIPAPNLNELKNFLPTVINNSLTAVQAMHLMKVMFVVKTPWWQQIQANYQAHRIPTRELHYYKSNAGNGMIMVYTDQPYNRFWQALFANNEQNSARINEDQDLIAGFCRYMPCQENEILSYCVRDWSKPPYNGAISFLKRGFNLFEHIKTTQSFNLSGDHHQPHNIFICGDTFSDYQGFIEGALRTTSEAIQLLSQQQATA